MNKVDDYMHRVLQVAGLPDQDEQGEELRNHIADLIAGYEAEGLDRERATDRALAEFGTPQRVGSQLREVTPLRLTSGEWLTVAVVMGMAAIGELLWPGPAFIFSVLTVGSAAALLMRHAVVGAVVAIAGTFLGGFVRSLLMWGPYNAHSGSLLHYPYFGGPSVGKVELISVALAVAIGLLAAIWREDRFRLPLHWGFLLRLAVFFAVGFFEFAFTAMPDYLLACAGVLLLQLVVVARKWPQQQSGQQRLVMVIAHLAPFLVVLDNLFTDVWEIVVFVATLALWYLEHGRCRVPSFDWRRQLAGWAQLAPLFVLFGLSWGAAATLVSLLIWHWSRDCATFVARHAAQGVVVGAAAVLSQVLVYQLVSFTGMAPALAVIGVALLVVRFTFALLAGWAAVSAFSGHDFRYPFAGMLIGGGNWRRFRHV